MTLSIYVRDRTEGRASCAASAAANPPPPLKAEARYGPANRVMAANARPTAAARTNCSQTRRRALNQSQHREAAARPLDADPVKVVEATPRRFALTECERTGVLAHLIRGGDLSAWGLANTVTRTAEDVAAMTWPRSWRRPAGR